MKDGHVAWNPRKQDANIERPAGPIDGSVPFVYFEAADGKPIAIYVNYALHLDTVGGHTSTVINRLLLRSLLSRLQTQTYLWRSTGISNT